MTRGVLLALVTVGALCAGEQEVVFRSDVALVRLDVQVLDSSRGAVRGLQREDFELRENGRTLPIRNFAAENMPIDVLLLLDVSGSMRPHVETIARASHQALRVMGREDRVGIMVFDRMTRLRLPFNDSIEAVTMEFDRLLRQESFRGGTDITRGLLDAAEYVRRNARPEARRAIVILTDDRTERERDEGRVLRALDRAEAVLSLLLAPDAMGQYTSIPGGGWPGGGGGGRRTGGWQIPGAGGGWPGGVILGRRMPGGGGGPVVLGGGGGLQSAGTPEIARESGGDDYAVNDAMALEQTLSRLRQRYALFFQLPAGTRAGEQRGVTVNLTASAARRYPSADLRYRPTYTAAGSSDADPNVTTVSEAPPPPDSGRGGSPREVHAPQPTDTATMPRSTTRDDAPPSLRRRPAVNERTSGSSSGPAPDSAPSSGGFRRLKPGEQP